MIPSANAIRVRRTQRDGDVPLYSQSTAYCLASWATEYAALCRRLIARLSRKRPTPLARGRAATWAAGVAWAIARVNFAFERAQIPHVTGDDIAAAFGVAKSTASARATHIERELGLRAFEPELTRAALVDEHPLAWLVAVDGLIVDARSLSVELQRQAHAQGLIPFAPAAEVPPTAV